MRKSTAFICCIVALCACDKHDPILPGVRTAIFDSASVKVLNQDITNVPETAFVFDNTNCPYSQDSANVIWDGERRVFSGFATNNSVSSNQQPVCDGKYLYAGLTTGEVVKLNPKTRQIIWIADIYSISNLTGGASMVDIVVAPLPHGNAVYAGGLSDAFCRISAASGARAWCLDIAVSVPFIIAGNYAFVVADDNNLYAIQLKDGAAIWRTPVAVRTAPQYADGIITVGDERIDVATGKIIL